MSESGGLGPEVRTRSGVLRGSLKDGVAAFLGVPYARAPVGALRFRAPEPAEPWDGVLEATAFGPTAPKRPYAPPLDALLPDPEVAGEACLNLNVWAPWPPAGDAREGGDGRPGDGGERRPGDGGGRGRAGGAGPAGRPVMVWIHGGSLVHGSSAVPVYDGTAFARDGVVLVSVNYRLGVEGFGVFPDAPGNLGLRDQIAALGWVRDTIGAFGGDPERVTVFGESAGAISIAALLTSPLAKGLFRRAVVQSGAPMALPLAEARRTTEAVAARLKVPATAKAFARVDRDRLLAAQTEVTGKGSPLSGGKSFQIAVDGEVVPRDPAEALAEGASADVDLLMGTTAEEYRLWFVPGGVTDRVGPWVQRLLLWKAKVPSATARVYRAGRPLEKPGEVLGALATDKLLRIPLNRLADARLRTGAPGGTYLYEFGWRSPVLDLGACHALELGFVFDTLGLPETRALTGPDAPRDLASAMHAAWVAFAATGDPGWRGWDPARPVMTFGPGLPSLVEGPREAERLAWEV
ncbi:MULTISPECIES: carboxylesterase family protein [unclassified Streptomyces]|uniref:carboxylesterase/lipase family protein n=1 Tax=unclassified Streptomyces TaxID=2593676 RepID=UPI0006F7A5CC|nr:MULTISPECIES: carboxylesterase family protein [unclassified Streptomyces]KQX57428.1 carboxylesterase [Streptomyces sp. Root1304]KRA98800.1 carboxylesterase [Streptomyces sp. Root66D1]